MFLTTGMIITIKGRPKATPLRNSQRESPASTMHSPRGISELEGSPLGTAPPVPHSRHKRPGQARNASGRAVTRSRAYLSKPLDLRNLLGDDAADVLRLGHHAICLKEAVVAAAVANRGNVNARVL